MDDLQKQKIRNLRHQKRSYTEIASELGLPLNTIKSFCQRNGLGGNQIIEPSKVGNYCRNCGAALVQIPKRKRRQFCSTECRVVWWKANPPRTEQATYQFTCLNCSERFEVYGNANRKYCNHACYVAARFQVAA